MLRSTATPVPCAVCQLQPVLLALLLLIPLPTHARSQGRPAQLTTCPASMVYGELIQCAILSAAELDSYTFNASAGDELLVCAGTVSGDLRPNLRLYQPDAVVACTNSSPYSPLVEIAVGLRSAARDRRHPERTDRQLRPPDRAAQSTGECPSADAGADTSGVILSAAQLDSYTFSVNSGDRLVLRMGVSSGTLRPLLRLYNAAGQRVCQGGTPYGPLGEIDGCTITTSGSHTLVLADNGNVRTGSYGVQVQRVSAPASPVALPITQSNVAAILSAGELDSYTLTAANAGPIMLRMGIASGIL